MNYLGLGANPDGSVTVEVNADLSDVKHIIENVSYGREQKSIQGNLKIRDEYSQFATYLNDTSGYYVNDTDYSYTMYRNGHELKTGKIKLVQNNIEHRELTFKLYDEIYDKYQEIFSKWDSELNIAAYFGGGASTLAYTDFRDEDTKSTSDSRGFSSQEDYNQYVDSLIESDDEWTPYQINCTGSVLFSITILWRQFYATGYTDGTNNFPPSGINWIYDSMVSGYPKYVKKQKHYSVDYGTFNPTAGTPPSQTDIYTERLSDIDYTSCMYGLKEVIGTFCVEQFNGGGSLSYDLSGFDDFTGEILPPSHPATSSSDKAKPYKNIQLIGMSDFIPSADGDQKTTRANTLYLNFKTISDFIESLGFVWYLDSAGSSPVLKVQHYTLRSLGSSNPDLSNYYNRNYLYKTRDIKINESSFDVITNEVEGAYEFSQPEYRFFDGLRKKTYQQNRIYMNIDHIIDAKSEVFDEISGKSWAAVLTTFYVSKYYTRYVYLSGYPASFYVNNGEGSFYWLARNNFMMPGRKSSGGDEFTQEYTEKRKEVTITVPYDNPQTDFSIYDYISYYGIDGEIQKIEFPTLAREGTITIKYH
jgi:hypothetical protein